MAEMDPDNSLSTGMITAVVSARQCRSPAGLAAQERPIISRNRYRHFYVISNRPGIKSIVSAAGRASLSNGLKALPGRTLPTTAASWLAASHVETGARHHALRMAQVTG